MNLSAPNGLSLISIKALLAAWPNYKRASIFSVDAPAPRDGSREPGQRGATCWLCYECASGECDSDGGRGRDPDSTQDARVFTKMVVVVTLKFYICLYYYDHFFFVVVSKTNVSLVAPQEGERAQVERVQSERTGRASLLIREPISRTCNYEFSISHSCADYWQ